jgi:hypothetical protein
MSADSVWMEAKAPIWIFACAFSRLDGAAIVTGSPEDFALEGSNGSFAHWWGWQAKLFVFRNNSPVFGLAWDVLLGNA